MGELVHEGKVRFLGVSNFSAEQLREAHDAVGERLVSLQNEYSLLKREIEADVMPECKRLGGGILPFFPLASGLLTGKYRRGEEAPEGTRLHGRSQVADDETFDRLERLGGYAREGGARPGEGDARGGAVGGADRRGHRGPCGSTGGGIGDRRGDQARAGKPQRQRRRVYA